MNKSQMRKIMKVPSLDSPLHSNEVSSAEESSYKPSSIDSSSSSYDSIDENDNPTSNRWSQKLKKKINKVKNSRKSIKSITKQKEKTQELSLQSKASPTAFTGSAKLKMTINPAAEKSCDSIQPNTTKLSTVSESVPISARFAQQSLSTSQKTTRTPPSEASTISQSSSETIIEFTLIMKELRQLAYDNRQQTAAIQELKRTLDDVLAAQIIRPTCESFERKYKLTIPFETIENFDTFDDRIVNDEEFRQALINSLSQKYDENKSITKNIAAILKRFISREVALLFNAQKRVTGKLLFKETKLSNILLTVIEGLAQEKAIPPVKETEYLVHLGAVLANVKDWGVPRSRPTKKRNQTPES